MKKHWTEYRYDELRIKTRTNELDDIEFPEFDMDGTTFHPELTEEEELRYDDLSVSESRRLYHISHVLMYENQCDLLESYE